MHVLLLFVINGFQFVLFIFLLLNRMRLRERAMGMDDVDRLAKQKYISVNALHCPVLICLYLLFPYFLSPFMTWGK